jgi:hypothetical protein
MQSCSCLACTRQDTPSAWGSVLAGFSQRGRPCMRAALQSPMCLPWEWPACGVLRKSCTPCGVAAWHWQGKSGCARELRGVGKFTCHILRRCSESAGKGAAALFLVAVVAHVLLWLPGATAAGEYLLGSCICRRGFWVAGWLFVQ